MKIRAETTTDYADIAQVNALAFGERSDEAALVMNLRQRRPFKPELSLVAEINGHIIGHAMFSPYSLRLLNSTVEAVNLAPLAVHKNYQKQGIGGALLETGHQIAKDMGYAFSFLLGHPSYYPRFGYLTHAFGASSVKVPVSDLPASSTLEARSVTNTDIPALHRLWQQTEITVDFSLDPGTDLMDWLNLNSHHTAQVYQRDSEIVGYARYDLKQVQHFLAADNQAAITMASMLSKSLPIEDNTLILPLHPYTAAASAFTAQPETKSWEPAMVCPLHPSPFDDYYARVQSGDHLPGYPIWPPAFDL